MHIKKNIKPNKLFAHDINNYKPLIIINSMNLEKRVNEGRNLRQTAMDLALAAASTTASYIIAGNICEKLDMSKGPELALTTGILTAGTVLGYKARSIFNRIKHRKKRNFARIRTIREMQKDRDFLIRQGIERKKLTRTQSALKYLLTVPLGGALSYVPGMVGVAPLCIYFGEKYGENWAVGSLTAGPVAGALAGAYAFGEMTAKKQYKRLVTTASTLIGVTAAYLTLSNRAYRCRPDIKFWNLFEPNSNILINMDKGGMWFYAGICAASGLVAGAIGNRIYKNHMRKTQNTLEA